MSDPGPVLPGHLTTMPAQHGPQPGYILWTHLTWTRSHTQEQATLAWAEGLDGEDLLSLGAGDDPVLVHGGDVKHVRCLADLVHVWVIANNAVGVDPTKIGSFLCLSCSEHFLDILTDISRHIIFHFLEQTLHCPQINFSFRKHFEIFVSSPSCCVVLIRISLLK